MNILKSRFPVTHPRGTSKEIREVVRRCLKWVQNIADYHGKDENNSRNRQTARAHKVCGIK
jgi:hypothetical protein